MLLFMAVSGFAAGDETKIAVVSEGKTVNSEVSPVAARGRYFLVFDGRQAFLEALDNPHRNAGSGASAKVADYLEARGVTTIIAGAFGNKMIAAMKAKRIRYLTFTGTAAAAVKKAVH